jgi:hypothetical protein
MKFAGSKGIAEHKILLVSTRGKRYLLILLYDIAEFLWVPFNAKVFAGFADLHSGRRFVLLLPGRMETASQRTHAKPCHGSRDAA